jgi:ring-1,2-phenylacetyl-CoA epoxidase subunit PaaD
VVSAAIPRTAPGTDRDPDGSAPGGRTITAGEVWDALAAVPDPELPALSLVDLGVIREVAVEGEGVRVVLTPTFLGCPALDAMRAAVATAIAGLGARAEVEVVLDDSWSSELISAEGRERLRRAGIAPPAPRSAGGVTLLQLERGPHRCPWCGSAETRLENIFGPTPCRSLRYCGACRQSFEQFKTV